MARYRNWSAAHVAALVASVLLSGCATSTGALPETGTRQTVQVSGVQGRLNIVSGNSASTSVIAEPMELVWRALPTALDSLGIVVTSVDASQFVMGADHSKVRQRLGKTPLSRYLDCGQTQIGPNADSYDVTLTVMVQLQRGAAGTTAVTTSVDATAQPIAFRQAPSDCSTKGVLESRLVALLQARASK